MKINVTKMELTDYLNHTFDCDCERKHSTAIQDVKVGSGVLGDIVDLMKKYDYKKAYIIADEITYNIAGKKVESILKEADISVIKHIFKAKNFIPNEKSLGEIMIDYEECDVIIAVGTGSINDLCRLASFKWGKPFFTVATAAPMDGFASSIAALVVNGLKTSYVAHPPKAIIGDTEILKGAPLHLITAGLGDTLGKYTCLCDWKLSNIINGEYYCPTVVDMVRKSVGKTYENSERISKLDPDAVGSVMESLVLTGIAMSFTNDSRPASGSEHHLTHFWETIFFQRNLPIPLHGAMVGVGTILILKLAELLQTLEVDFNKARRSARQYDNTKWEKEIKRVYGSSSEGIINLENHSGKNNIENRLKRIDKIEQNWKEICNILKHDLIPASELKDLLGNLGAPVLPEQIGIDDKTLWDSIIYAKEVRSRYTILQMIWDLGLSEYMADYLVNNK